METWKIWTVTVDDFTYTVYLSVPKSHIRYIYNCCNWYKKEQNMWPAYRVNKILIKNFKTGFPTFALAHSNSSVLFISKLNNGQKCRHTSLYFMYLYRALKSHHVTSLHVQCPETRSLGDYKLHQKCHLTKELHYNLWCLLPDIKIIIFIFSLINKCTFIIFIKRLCVWC